MNLMNMFDSGEGDLFAKILKTTKKIIQNLPKENTKELDKKDSIENVISYSDLNEIKKDSKEPVEDNNDNSVHEIFKNVSVPKKRIEKYKIYDELYDSLQVIKNVIMVYINNISPSDNISNESIFIKPTDLGENNNDKFVYYKENAEDLKRYFEFEEMCDHIILPQTLKYGDLFLEIIDIEEKQIDYKKIINKKYDKGGNGVILENTEFKNKSNAVYLENLDKLLSENKFVLNESDISKLGNIFINFNEQDSIIDYNDIILEKRNLENRKKIIVNGEKSKFDIPEKIVLKPHLPHNIVPILTSYNTIVGYVYILPEEMDSDKSLNVQNPFNSMLNIVNKISNGMGNKTTATERYDIVVKKFAAFITKNIIDKNNLTGNTEDKNKIDYENALKSILEPKIYLTLKGLVYSANERSVDFNKLNVKFIQPKNIVHYSINNSFSYPFGTSILDPLVFPGKMYLLTLMTNMIIKVSRASLVRNWKIEVGSRLDHRRQVENLKRQLRNSRLTASDLISTKNLSNIMTDFRDVFTILQNGKEKIAVDLLQQGSPDVKIQDLEDLRRELIALTGIPGSMLGFPDQGGNDTREYLVNTNIAFATKISNMQRMFNNRNTELFEKMMDKLNITKENDRPSEYISLSFLPPTVLTMQLVSSAMQSSSDMIRTLADLEQYQIDSNYFLEKFCPWIDWNDFRVKNETFKIEKAAKKATSAVDQQDGGMGGY